MVTFTLTNRQAERIRLLLWNMDDDGPRDEGWKSRQLKELCHAVGYPLTWGKEERAGIDFNSLDGDDLPEIMMR
jgi:hypothetical protein